MLIAYKEVFGAALFQPHDGLVGNPIENQSFSKEK
jgi:hypothetical protein